MQARIQPEAVAIQDISTQWTFGQLHRRVNRLANALAVQGIKRGDRVAILAENCIAYVELELAAAKLGAIVPCLNWRLSDSELVHCIRLTSPSLIFVSERYAPNLQRIDHRVSQVVRLDSDYEAMLGHSSEQEPQAEVQPGDRLVILYASGTTGFPKGAVISHRAMIARLTAFSSEFGITRRDTYIAWSPLFHMAATDFSLGTLMLGAQVLVGWPRYGLAVRCPGAGHRLAGGHAGNDRILIEGLKRRNKVKSIKQVGAMADLVPLHQIAELTSLLQAPMSTALRQHRDRASSGYRALIPVGEVAKSLSKRESNFCNVRLVDPEDRDVRSACRGDGGAGPTLFSGYWQAPETNAKDFRGGWFHLGICSCAIRRHPGFRRPGKISHQIRRRKHLSGRNRRVLLSSAGCGRRGGEENDPKWGEVPIAFVAATSTVAAEGCWPCRQQLAGYNFQSFRKRRISPQQYRENSTP